MSSAISMAPVVMPWSFSVPEKSTSPSPTPRMLTVPAAARLLGLHPVTVRKNLPLHRVGARSMVRVADVQKITGEASDARACA